MQKQRLGWYCLNCIFPNVIVCLIHALVIWREQFFDAGDYCMNVHVYKCNSMPLFWLLCDRMSIYIAPRNTCTFRVLFFCPIHSPSSDSYANPLTPIPLSSSSSSPNPLPCISILQFIHTSCALPFLFSLSTTRPHPLVLIHPNFRMTFLVFLVNYTQKNCFFCDLNEKNSITETFLFLHIFFLKSDIC